MVDRVLDAEPHEAVPDVQPPAPAETRFEFSREALSAALGIQVESVGLPVGSHGTDAILIVRGTQPPAPRGMGPEGLLEKLAKDIRDDFRCVCEPLEFETQEEMDACAQVECGGECGGDGRDADGNPGALEGCWWCQATAALAAAPRQPPAVVPPDLRKEIVAWLRLMSPLHKPAELAEKLEKDDWRVAFGAPAPAVLPVETPPAESDGDGCQACADGVDHISCEPYFVPAPPKPATPPPVQPVHICDVKGCQGEAGHARAAAVQPGAPTATPACLACRTNHDIGDACPAIEKARAAPAAVQPIMGERARCECGHGKDEHFDLRFGCKRMDDVEGIVSFCKCQKFKRPAQPTPGDAGARPADLSRIQAERDAAIGHVKALVNARIRFTPARTAALVWLAEIHGPLSKFASELRQSGAVVAASPPRRQPEELAREAEKCPCPNHMGQCGRPVTDGRSRRFCGFCMSAGCCSVAGARQ